MKMHLPHRMFVWQTLLLLIAATGLPLSSALAQTSACPNADFSMNNFTNWTGRTGSCCPINVPTLGIVNGRHTIVGPGNDIVVGANLPTVPQGYTTAARLGNNSTGAQAEELSYTIPNVTLQNALFIYNYAVVMQDPGHAQAQQPRFELQVRNANGQIIPCTYYQVAAGNNIPGFLTFGGSIRYKPWTKVGVDLLQYLGSPITIEARTGDCSLSGHYGYGYITASCQPMEIQVDYCIGDTIAVLNAPDGFQSYQWSTGATTKSIVIMNPAQVQTPISVTVTSVSGCVATLSVNLTPALVTANFNASNGCNGIVGFTDLSTVSYGGLSQWSWDFGDGNTSNQQNPSHTYTQPGTYNVSLHVVSQGNCTADTVIQVTVPPIVVAGFTIPTNGCGLNQTFIDATQLLGGGSIQSLQWFVNNAPVSNQSTVNYTFPSPGTYTVTLISTNNANCSDTATQQLTINAIPVANFSAPRVCEGSPTIFTDQSTVQGGGLQQWNWTFGDGNNGTGQNTSHQYQNAGTYNARLVVTGPGGCTDTIVRAVRVLPRPVPCITLPASCGLTQTFTDCSTIPNGTITGHNWVFNPGSSNLQNPANTFPNPGTYNISLTVTSDSGCVNTTTVPYTVYAIPVASFTAPMTCHPNPVPFNTTTTLQGNGLMTYQWNFGDGSPGSALPTVPHAYANPGTYTATLIATGPGGCSDTVTRIVNTPPSPVAGFTLPPQCNLTDFFQNTSTISNNSNLTYSWNFGDGSPLSNQVSPTHTYASPGTYPVVLTVTSDSGCTASILWQNITWDVPVAAFSAPPVCHGNPTLFTDNSTNQGGIVNQSWSFGNGNSGTGSNPSQNYANPGSYPVQLIVTGPGGCADTIVQQIYVPATPVAQFALPSDCGLTNGFTDQSTIQLDNIINWQWNFGDNGTSGQQHPTHTYLNQGTWSVTLIVTSDQGCTDTIVQPFLNRVNPVANFQHGAVCFGTPNAFTDQSTVQLDSITQWNWNFNYGSASSQHGSFTFPSDGTHNVQLIVWASNGCSDTITQAVTVHPKPIADFSVPNVCNGLVSSFTDLTSFPNQGTIQNWNWDLVQGSSSAQHPTITYSTFGTYNAQLIVTSNHGCTDTIIKPVNVWPRPNLSFDFDPRAGCAPLAGTLINTSVIDQNPGNSIIAQYLWDFGDNTTSTSPHPGHVYLNPGVYSITLTAISDKGCDTSISRNNYVTVFPVPMAEFKYSPSNPTVVDPVVSFLNLSSGETTYAWDFGDGNTASVENPFNKYPNDSASYIVTLAVTNEYGCIDSVQHTVVIMPDYTIFIPNTFTPNKDGNNEAFKIYGTGIKEAELTIFDRWGEKLAELNKKEPMEKGWDGTHGGRLVKQDVYVYRARVRDLYGKWHEFYGQINVMK